MSQTTTNTILTPDAILESISNRAEKARTEAEATAVTSKRVYFTAMADALEEAERLVEDRSFAHSTARGLEVTRNMLQADVTDAYLVMEAKSAKKPADDMSVIKARGTHDGFFTAFGIMGG